MALAVGVGPGIAFKFAPIAQFGEPASLALGHEDELVTEPALGGDASGGELDQGAGQQGGAVAGVVGVGPQGQAGCR